jgi:hypothetical protein
MAITKGETKNGFKYEYDNDVFANWEVMEWFTEILEIQDIPEEDRTNEDNMIMLRDMYAVIRKVFTRSQIAAWKKTNRDENGEVVADWMWEDFADIFLETEDKETKNS